MPRFTHRLSREIPVDALEARLALMSAAGNQTSPANLQAQDPERDPTAVTTAALDDLAPPAVFGLLDSSAVVQSTLPEVEDHRTFHPDDLTRPLRTVRGSRSSTRAAPIGAASSSTRSSLSAVQFAKSAHVIICIRRHARRAAILALGHGGGHHRRDPKWKDTSDIRC